MCLISCTESETYVHVVLRDGGTVFREPPCTKALWMTIKKHRLFIVNFIVVLIERLMTKFFNQKLQIWYNSQRMLQNPPPPTIPYVGSSTENAKDQSVSCIHFSFLNSSLLSTPTDKSQTDFNARFIQLYLSNHSELDIYLRYFF